MTKFPPAPAEAVVWGKSDITPTPPATLPVVAEADALSDRAWFADHPDRRFRARAGDGGVWLRRRIPQSTGPDAYLRTVARLGAIPRDDEAGIERLWWQAAHPRADAHGLVSRVRQAGSRK